MIFFISFSCRYVTYMINNYKVDKALECELYLIYGKYFF